VELDHLEAIEEVLAEGAGLDAARQVAVGGGEHPHVDAARSVLAHTPDLALLKGAEELDLHGGRDVADLVEEQRSAVRRLKQPGTVGTGAGERAAHVAKELALEQRLGDGGAVDGHEGACGAE
jgi:uncharacterized protein YoaH (UPF0181 family)